MTFNEFWVVSIKVCPDFGKKVFNKLMSRL